MMSSKLSYVFSVFGFVLALGAPHGLAQTTNTVSNVGFSAYSINGTNNPTLTLTRGVTYRFNVNASGHPFWIKTAATTGIGDAYNNGVVNNGTQAGTLTFAVPADAPSTLFYICQFHSAMKGTFNIVSPRSPPAARIVAIKVGQSVEIASTGAVGWSPVPEFSDRFPATSWMAISPFTNVFANGTNLTSFGRLDSPSNPNVFIRIRQTQN
jgi:hypothetical protein